MAKADNGDNGVKNGARSRAKPRLIQLGRRARGFASLAVGARGWSDARALAGPLFAQISVADPCNHRCVMCPYHPPDQTTRDVLPKFGETRPGVMTLSTFERLIDDLAASGTLRVDLVGRGEPLLNRDVPAMIRAAGDRRLETAITTNGSLLSPAMAMALCDAGLDRVKVSLNAGTRGTYPQIHVTESPEAYDRVVANLRDLCARPTPRPHVTLSFTVGSMNADELESMIDRAIEIGADAAYFQHLVPVEGRPELSLTRVALERLHRVSVPAAQAKAAPHRLDTNLAAFDAEALDRAAALDGSEDDVGVVPCYVGYYFTVVLGNGNVMACCQIDRPLGDVSKHGFSELWNGESYRAFRRAARRLPVVGPELETAECDRCYFRPHNVSVHRAVHPLSSRRVGSRLGGARFSLRQALGLMRLDDDE